VWTGTPVVTGQRRSKADLVVGLTAAAASAAILGYAIHVRAESDLQAHTALTIAGLKGGHFPGNPLFYWLDALLAGFKADEHRLFRAMVVILAASVGAKAYLTVRFAAGSVERMPRWGALLIGLGLLAFGLPIGLKYPAFVPPNVWHNSTTMLLMPFAFGLFWASLQYLREPSRNLLWLMLVLVALNVLAKPSFLFCWLAVFPIAVLLRERRPARLVGPALVCLAGGLFTIAEYVYIYKIGDGDPSNQPSGVRIAPMHVWSFYTDHEVLSFLAGFAFPIVALILGGAAIRSSWAVRYAGGLAIVGLLWFVLFTETGYREFHGNFMWQAIVTNYLLFAAVLTAVVAWVRETRLGRRQLLVLAVFGLHVLGGLLFFVHWLGVRTIWS
jgi:hypothetical protein